MLVVIAGAADTVLRPGHDVPVAAALPAGRRWRGGGQDERHRWRRSPANRLHTYVFAMCVHTVPFFLLGRCLSEKHDVFR